MIRPYTAADLPAAMEVWYAASKLAHPFLADDFLAQERETIAAQHMPHAEVWVFARAVAVAGFIALSGNEVGGLFVDPRYHGQGVGRALMDHARSLRDVLELDVFKDNALGRRFYARYGFQVIGEYTHRETGFPVLRLRLGAGVAGAVPGRTGVA